MESGTTTASDTNPAYPDLSTGLKQPGVSPRELDDSLYKMEEQALEFFRAQTGIEDADELKRHVLAVQAEAYAVRARAPARAAILFDTDAPFFPHT